MITIFTTIVFKQYEEVKLKRHFDKDAHDENQGTDHPSLMNIIIIIIIITIIIIH